MTSVLCVLNQNIMANGFCVFIHAVKNGNVPADMWKKEKHRLQQQSVNYMKKQEL